MKQLFLTFTLLVVATSFAQKLSGKVSGLIISKPEYSMNDSIIRVVYSKPRFNFTKKPAIYINGVLAKEINLLTMNSNEIESMNIEKEEIEIDNVKYYGKVYIKTKDNFSSMPRHLISLNNLKEKYINSLNGSIIFQIDNERITADYDQYLVDEKHILKIIVEDFENEKEKLKLHFVTLVTKTEENVKKANEIRIRGGKDIAID
ncbi:hypothetical protein [Flavobacterium ammonificans]|jgi:hypothetical protein|uniref:hypothetical protein n=1 Tax=Flavobacterium ammonificans TaxID=1751056 RepID=UPI001E4E8E4B|nr:hypothetical protein [Flavobacterium ammonificans]BDB57349.1 hypothetical protein SHINM13_16450 [Flavobacterium ammonificans]